MPQELYALRSELERLTLALQRKNAFVFDAWGLVWCWASFPEDEERERLLAHVKAVLLGVTPPLQRGGALSGTFASGGAEMYCQSFASVYALGVWGRCTGREFALRRALPTIERLTLALPPPTGPGRGAGSGFGRA